MQIFFESNETLEDCHAEIKRLQGFSDLRSEYSIIRQLSKGSYPCVLLARHKKSKIKVVLQMVSSIIIEHVFHNPAKPYQEAKLLEELALLKCKNVLELID